MGKIICKFCNEKKDKSKEHIWPKWLQKHIVGNTKGNFRGSHILMSSGVVSERNQSGESLVFGNICTDCNNGWMANLENEFRPIYLEIESDYSKLKRLSKKERIIICKWTLKTIMMINAGTNYREIIPDNHYKHLFEYRNLPKDIKVDISYINSEENLMWEQSNITMASMKTNDSNKYDPYDLTRNSYVITLQIKNFGIKVIHYSGLKEKGYEISPSDIEKSLRIWPLKKNNQFDLKNTYKDISDFHMSTRIMK
ncbi:hypothetical protein [Algibacter sp. L4_22]|uniref:hypothetical protein n=1 Tax=Algibacter sp. L4_22 TaxID=2942477 RepID=UPI00201B8946|nr:hypothetical protein [Algibacter sp. L4_22]MCL5130582.1 hypothetical protein [Algibacter sp. L4_22]